MINISVNPLTLIDRYSTSIPVPVFQILQELGLGPERRPLDNHVSGWIERRDNGQYGVVINSTHPMTRQRFTAAHELGHFIYHRSLLGAGVGDNRAYRTEGTPLPNSAIRPVHERQANSFAANLLMSRAAIEALRAEGVTSPAALAERLGVSQDAMRIRLGLPRL
jgi:hypothetical protein